MARTVRAFDLGTQPAHEDLEVFGGSARITAPHAGQQHMMWHNPTGVRHQVVEQPEVDRRETHRQPPTCYSVVPNVDGEFARHEVRVGVRGAIRLDASQQGLETSEQGEQAEGLDYILIGAELQAAHLAQLLSTRGEQDDRHRRLAPDFLQHGEAVANGERDLQQHDVGVRFAKGARRARVVPRQDRPTLRPLEAAADRQDIRPMGIVVDHQDVHGCCPSGNVAVAADTGRATKKVLPLPGALSTHSRPPWSSTTARTMGKPSPVPALRRVRSGR
jgi:hypothetical protein